MELENKAIIKLILIIDSITDEIFFLFSFHI